MSSKKHSKPSKQSSRKPEIMGDRNRAVRARESASRQLADKDVPGDRGAAEKKSLVQGSE